MEIAVSNLINDKIGAYCFKYQVSFIMSMEEPCLTSQ